MVVALLAAAPAQAEARWSLSQVSSSVNGDPNLPTTSYAYTCGFLPFGDYRFIVGVTDQGRQGSATWDVRLSGDGEAHQPRNLRFQGYVSERLQDETRQLLQRVAFRVTGTPAEVQSVFRDSGEVQARRPFDPRSGAYACS